MAYSDFTLKRVKSELNLQIMETLGLFATIEPIPVSDALHQSLKRNLPLALAINTEKARSELIVINILLELREQRLDQISLFSGIDFNIDKDQGLVGYCDYIISASPEQFYVEKPVIAIVEAKNENLVSGLGQCVAEMYAADLYNAQENGIQSVIYGAVTTGDEWRFLKLMGRSVHIDLDSYYISEIEKILGILVQMTCDQT